MKRKLIGRLQDERLCGGVDRSGAVEMGAGSSSAVPLRPVLKSGTGTNGGGERNRGATEMRTEIWLASDVGG
jgi:hypothetical protein